MGSLWASITDFWGGQSDIDMGYPCDIVWGVDGASMWDAYETNEHISYITFVSEGGLGPCTSPRSTLLLLQTLKRHTETVFALAWG